MQPLREIEFYDIYRDRCPVLYEVLMDTLEAMYFMRQDDRFLWSMSAEYLLTPTYFAHGKIAFDIDRTLGVNLRYGSRSEDEIMRLAINYNIDFEELYRIVADMHVQSAHTFNSAIDYVEGYLQHARLYQINPLNLNIQA